MTADPWEALREIAALEAPPSLGDGIFAITRARAALAAHDAAVGGKEAIPQEWVETALDAFLITWPGDNDEAERIYYSDAISAAIDAVVPLILAAVGTALASPVPDGWVVVPMKPTREMLERGGALSFQDATVLQRLNALAIYEAMLAAAPEWSK